MEKKIPFRFNIDVLGGLTPTDDPSLFTCRVRVFYKYSNRNGSYITDAFAEKLIASAGWKPLVGFYNHETEDFEGHTSHNINKAYGFVLPGTERWEKHTDCDGKEREYVAVTLMIWAEYWEEAKKIIGKGHSMEINDDAKGTWENIDGMEQFVFTEGYIEGLCILGDLHEPCFKGAAFYEVEQPDYHKFSLAIQKIMHTYSNEGGNNMNIKVFGIEAEHFEEIWEYLNPNFEERGEIDAVPYEITEDSFSVFACDGKKKKYSVKYEEIGEGEEKKTVANYEVIEEIDDADLAAKFEALTNEYATLQSTLAANQKTFETKTQEYESRLAELQAKLDSASANIANYEARETQANNEKKETLISKFALKLPKEDLEAISQEKDNLSVDELEAKLSVAFTRNNIDGQADSVPTLQYVSSQYEQLAAILNKHRK